MRQYHGRSPYRLYALSNVASLLALLSYPVTFERALGLHTQAWLWSGGGYLLFTALCVAIAILQLRNATRDTANRESTPHRLAFAVP